MQCYGLNLLYSIIKVVAYEALVNFYYLYANDVASNTGECSEHTLFRQDGRYFALPRCQVRM